MSSVSRAEERYAHYLVERDEGRAGPFETWVSSQGELADELRALHARWQAFRPRFEQLVASPEVDSEGAALLSRLASRPAAGARFELRGEVGCGGMGHVQRVFDPELARELALKTARLDQGSAARRRARTARLLAEARITGALQHPGIVPIHELGLDADGQVYYTMPLIAGEDLERLFARVRAGEPGWTRARVLSCLARVCETMAYAHARGVVHGDLKPSNVRVGTFGEVYVMDWGLAQRVGVGAAAPDDDEEERGTEALPRSRLFGTPAYLAPEALDPLVRAPDPRSDVFAVGAMLYRLLTGSVPHEAELARASGLEALRAVRARPLAPLPAAAGPPELLAITARALAVRPEQRYPDMRALAEDLRAFLEDRVVRAHATGPWVELLKWIRRNRAFAGALAALVSSLAGGLLASHSFFLDARASEARTRAERDRVLRLADVKRLTDLEARADELWPALPALEADYVDWLARADELVGRLELHRRTSNELDAAVTGSAAAGPTFVATERQWERDTLAGLVGGLERLIGAGGRLTDVRARLALARGLEERSRGSEEARTRWAEAALALADRDRCPAYGGLTLVPQLGLLPLGPDPRSGLWEFAHLASGTPAKRAATGELVFDEASGIVLVLIPGGTFLMGAQSEDSGLPNYSPERFDNEEPPHEVELAAFFLAKHELTQAQWLRATGVNPSTYAPGNDEAEVTLLHPLETVSRGEALVLARRLALDLPTEAQWEYAARAGTTTPWWTGAAPQSLAGAANLADQAVVRAGGQWPQIESWLDDGYFRHAPVLSLRANPFGLHHVLGNVWEWTRDDFGNYDLSVRPGDGLRVEPGGGLPVGRGGGYVNNAAFARVSLRDSRSDSPHLLFGLRPSRALER